MSYLNPNALPTDRNLEHGSDAICIQSISDYMKKIEQCVNSKSGQRFFPVYRGEPRLYPSPCLPNLFRADILAENPFFEKNLFDAMRQSRITDENRYLDNAIDAQHGEFPSRLLDVTYNCLIALYFAVTPYYREKEDSLDEEDGRVFVFFINEIFSPSAKNTNDNYEAIINRELEWTQSSLFRKNHKFIDHIKRGPRVIAQQSAFILFQGDIPEELPKGMYYGVRIPAGAKKRLRRQLRQLFGIHTGSIYPETINLVKDLTQKSGQMNTQPYSCQNELHYTLRQMKRELDDYLDYAVTQKRAYDRTAKSAEELEEFFQKILCHAERVINSYREGFLHFIRDYQRWETPFLLPEQLKNALLEYNEQLCRFAGRMESYRCGTLACDSLKIQINEPGNARTADTKNK